MELRSCRTNIFLALLCALSLTFNTVHADTKTKGIQDQQLTKNQTTERKKDSIDRRQDNGFDFMRYFTGSSGQQNQQPRQSQQTLTLQQQHQLQQQQLAQQQLQQQKQLQALQQQQLLQQLQQHQPSRSNDVYQDNQQQDNTLNRDGGYGYPQQPKQIGISLGGGGKRPNVIPVGNILTLLPRIINILSAGGKVMFGVELGNNFYFGPVGAKPLHG